MMAMSLRGRAPLIVLCGMLAAAAAQGGEMRRVEGLSFDQVDVVGSVKVEVSQGDDPQLQLYGDAGDLDRKPFYVDGRRLVLGRTDRRSEDDFGEVKYRVVLPQLRDLSLRGSGQVYVKAMQLVPARDRDATRFSVEGSGDIKIYGLEGPSVEMRIKGSGDIKAVEVTVERFDAVVAGSGDLYIQTLQASQADISVTGSGDVKVTDGGFVHTLETNVVGSGGVDLRRVGAEIVEANIIGSGDIDLGEVLTSIQGSILGSGDVRYDGDPTVETVQLGSGECRRRD